MDSDHRINSAVSPEEGENYTKCYIYVHQLWKENRKKEFTEKMQHSFRNASNPYKMAQVCIKLCPDLYSGKGNGMAANVAVELLSFLNGNREKYAGCLDENMQRDVFQVAIKQKNVGIMRLLVKAYQLGDIKDQFLPVLRDMILQQRFKDVCILATLLELQKEFSTEELLVPLFCLDHLCLADEFLDSSPDHQRELLLFIDDLIGKKPEALGILEKYAVKDPSSFKSSKVLSNTAAKLLKRYKWDMSLFPHLHRRRTLGALRFLFYKYYIEKGLQMSAFHSLINDAVKETPDLKADLINLFSEYCDPVSAVPYVSKLNLNVDDLPTDIRDAVLTSSVTDDYDHHLQAVAAQEEIWNEDDDDRYMLSIPFDHVLFIDTVAGFEETIKALSDSSIIAVDCEWKPTFGIVQGEQLALLQLANLTHVYLIDIITLLPLLESCHFISLGQVFLDQNITKLGYGIRGDFKILAKLHVDLKSAITGAKNVMDFDQKKAELLTALPEFFSFSPSSYKGLSDLIYRCFGKPLDKNEQFSNWADRPLSRSQRTYAALDARCLIDVYNHFNKVAEELNIDDWRAIKCDTPPKAARKHKPKAKNGSTNRGALDYQNRGEVSAKDFHVICDTMLQGLAKKLRLCGVDALALENGQSCDECIPFYEKEQRIVLSRGSAHARLGKFIPSQYIFHVQSEGAKEQLVEVMKAFSVRVSQGDLFARCTKCNSGHYLTVPASVIQRIKKNEGSPGKKEDEWISCGDGKINVSSGLTERGVKIMTDKVIDAVLKKTDKFYVCAQCGRCYWEGSHQDRAFKEILSKFIADGVDVDVSLLDTSTESENENLIAQLSTGSSETKEYPSDIKSYTSYCDSDSSIIDPNMSLEINNLSLCDSVAKNN